MRLKLKWIPITFSVTIIFISFVFLYSYFDKTLISWEEEHLLNAADTLLLHIAENTNLFKQNPEAFIFSTSKGEITPVLILVEIINNQGQIIAKSPNLHSRYIPYDQQGNHYLKDIILSNGERFKIYQDDIIVNGQKMGSIIVGTPRAQVIHALQKLLRILVIVFCCSIIILSYGINALLNSEIIASQKKFLSFISHEMRTALFSLSGKAEVTLRSGQSNVKYKKTLQEIYDETQTLTKLVNDLLLLFRKEHLKSMWEMGKVAITELAAEAVSNVKSRYPDRSYILTIQKPLLVKGDMSYLKQLLINLIDNAAKYSEPRGKITINITSQHRQCVINISDKGKGIDKKFHKKIFDPFFRTETSLPGTGLGLAIAKWIVTAHRGTIVVESLPGRGTKVQITLPLFF